MGYHTCYDLHVSNLQYNTADAYTKSSSIPDIVCRQLEEYIEERGFFDPCGDCGSGWSTVAKWYDWEGDMITMSKTFPEVLFELHGVGDDSEDLWFAYFYQGKVQHCPAKIIYDDFDPKKLT